MGYDNAPYPSWLNRPKEALIRGVIWGFVGILFGSLFVTVYHVALPWKEQVSPLMVAGVLSAGLGALIYGSMRLAVIIAAFCSVLAVGLLVIAEDLADPMHLLLRVGLLGLVVGALYGAFARNSRVHRADAKTITGLVSGVLVSGLLLGLMGLLEVELSIGWTVALLCPLVGLVYTRLVEWFIVWFEHLLPPVGDGALVGLGVASYIAVGLWLVAGYIDPLLLGSYASDAADILGQLPAAVLGGMSGGFIGGFIGGMLGMKWQDL